MNTVQTGTKLCKKQDSSCEYAYIAHIHRSLIAMTLSKQNPQKIEGCLLCSKKEECHR